MGIKTVFFLAVVVAFGLSGDISSQARGGSPVKWIRSQQLDNPYQDTVNYFKLFGFSEDDLLVRLATSQITYLEGRRFGGAEFGADYVRLAQASRKSKEAKDLFVSIFNVVNADKKDEEKWQFARLLARESHIVAAAHNLAGVNIDVGDILSTNKVPKWISLDKARASQILGGEGIGATYGETIPDVPDKPKGKETVKPRTFLNCFKEREEPTGKGAGITDPSPIEFGEGNADFGTEEFQKGVTEAPYINGPCAGLDIGKVEGRYEGGPLPGEIYTEKYKGKIEYNPKTGGYAGWIKEKSGGIPSKIKGSAEPGLKPGDKIKIKGFSDEKKALIEVELEKSKSPPGPASPPAPSPPSPPETGSTPLPEPDKPQVARPGWDSDAGRSCYSDIMAFDSCTKSSEEEEEGNCTKLQENLDKKGPLISLPSGPDAISNMCKKKGLPTSITAVIEKEYIIDWGPEGKPEEDPCATDPKTKKPKDKEKCEKQPKLGPKPEPGPEPFLK